MGGRQRYLTIGTHGSPLTPDLARNDARRLLGAIHAGNDPATQRDKRSREPTVGDVLDRYLKEHVATHYKPSTAGEATRHVKATLKPAFGKLKINELTRADIKRWHTTLGGRPYEGNRALGYFRKALSLAVNEWELRVDNPALGVKKFPETRRERFFSDAELRHLGVALVEIEAEGKTLAGCIRVVRLLALTGMRLSEVIGTQWAWINFDEGCVRLPDAKAGARAVPLGGPALAYLASLERIGSYVCYGTDPQKPISLKTVENFWPILRDRAELTNARMHDLRHTVGTLAAQTGANAFTVRDLLGHRSLSQTDTYVARDVDPLRKTADQVSSRIAAAMNGGPTAEIVPLRKST
jgi:integrase